VDSCSTWADCFGVAFLVTDVSDLRLARTFVSEMRAVSDLLVLVVFSALLPFLAGVRDGDFD